MLLSTSIFQYNQLRVFFLWTAIYLIITYATSEVVLTGSFYHAIVDDQLAVERAESIFTSVRSFQWIGYIILPLMLIVKFFIVSGIIFIGSFLYQEHLPFNSCFRIVMLAEIVPMSAAVFKLFFFILYHPTTIEAVQLFYPLSVLNLFDAGQLPTYLIYPVQQVNLFELIYWLVLSAGIQAMTPTSLLKSFRISATSYGSALVVWVLCVVFIQLQFT